MTLRHPETQVEFLRSVQLCPHLRIAPISAITGQKLGEAVQVVQVLEDVERLMEVLERWR